MDSQRGRAAVADGAYDTGRAIVAAVQRDIDEADHATRRLLELSARGLVPPAHLPREVFALRDRDTAGAEKLALHVRWVAAKALVGSCKSIVLDSELRPWPDRGIAKFRADLAAAEKALGEARAAAMKAGSEIPDS